jgi:acyl-coenzyme A synthetase/AMP-(fatty) acid ligase
VATTDPEDILRGSVGRPEPGSVTIVGRDHRPVPRGVVGQLAFSRAFYPVRYWGGPGGQPDPPVLRDSDRPDWFYSDDLGRLDERGRLYIHGRLTHQIDRGGLKVDPVEVESALLDCPGVADAVVIGQADRVLGEKVVACVCPATGCRPTLEDVRRALAGTLSSYKLPDTLHLLEQIPRTPLGKVDLPGVCRLIAAVPDRDPTGR